jgi:RNA polymerase sigma factor (sigma-70 family)
MMLSPPAESDPLLQSYLEAGPDTASGAPLAALFALHAEPIIDQIVRAKRSRTKESSEAADVASAAREHLIRQLTALRTGEREPIRDFRSYVASVTYSAWSEFLRERHPQRAMLLNRLRYLLENRTTKKGFALWDDADGARWCGFSSWRERMGGASPKLQWLLVDPTAAADEALHGADPAGLILPDLVARLLRWLGGPIELRDLTTALSELSGFTKDQAQASEESSAEADPRSSPAEELIWKEYLRWLWQEISALSERQRRAFLLHSDVLRDFDLLGIASIRSAATCLELEATELATLWNRLPLDDLTIAKMLDCSRQQVINLRRVARDKLGEAWRNWSG